MITEVMFALCIAALNATIGVLIKVLMSTFTIDKLTVLGPVTYPATRPSTS
nr:hypothetical protein [Pseudomonas ogarae]